jgi:outer membrane lipase/esterase
MGLWRRCAVLVGGLVLLAEVPARAQGLNEVLIGRLSNSCSGLSGPGIPPGSGNPPNPDYGPQLLRLCGDLQANNGTGSASSAGGITSAEDRISIGVDERIRRRTQERRAASADRDGVRGLGLFFTADYERFEQDTTRFEAGFGRDTVGGTVGVDYVLNPFALVGLGFNYAHEFGNYDSGGGFDNDSYGVLLYTSLSPIPGAFVDLVAGYVRKEYDFERRVLLDIPQSGGPLIHVDGKTRADTDSDEFRFSAHGGYDFVLRNITVGPRLGVNYRDTSVDGFRESGGTGVELAYENQNIVSLTTQAGVYASIAISTGIGVIVPQTTVEYVHEFLDDQRTVGFRFVQDLRRRKFLYQTDPPDRDYVNVALGVSMLFPGGVTAFANFRELVGYRDRSSHAVSLGLRLPF